MQHAVKTLLVAAVATVSRALVVQPARPHHPLRRCGSPVLCEPVERTLDAEFDVIDTRYFGPALSPATWARIGRDKLRALVTDRKSEANFAWHTINSPGRVLFSERSALGNGLVTITAHGPWRCMMFDEVEQGIAYFEDGDAPRYDVLGFQYLRVMAAAAMAARQLAVGAAAEASADSDSVLCVGLGTGALPAFLAHNFGPSGLRVEVVEIDPVVVKAARDALQCNFRWGEEGRGRDGGAPQDYELVLADAAAHLQRVVIEQRLANVLGKRRPGLRAIFLDAFNAEGETPEHLLRPGFLRSCRDALAPGGVIVANLFNGATGSDSRRVSQRFAAVLEDAVGPVMSLEVPTQEESLVLVAQPGAPTDRPGRQDLVGAARDAWAPVGLGGQAAQLVRRMYWVETGGARSLINAEGGGRRFVEYVPPPSTADGASIGDAASIADELRVGSSAVEWVAGAGPPHGCPKDGCELDDVL